MNDVGRYRVVFARLWRHAGFRALSPVTRLVVLYLLTGPQTNRIGLFHLSVATAAEDLKVAAETIRKALADVATTFGWLFDADGGVFYIPSWWKWNRPQNPNHLQGNLKDLNEVPASALVDAFAQNVATLPETYHQTFLEGVSQRLSGRSGNQNLDLDRNLKRERKPRASRGDEKTALNDGLSSREAALLACGREVLTLMSPTRPIDELIDGLQQVAGPLRPARSEALRALTVLLPQHHGATA